MTESLFIFHQLVAKRLNGFRKHGKSIILKHEWYVMLTFLLDFNNSYNHNMNSIDLSDQLLNVYQVYNLMSKYKWWWSIFFGGRGLFLVNAYIIYKTLCEEGKVKPISNYEFRSLVFLVKIDPTYFGDHNHLVS